MRALRTVLVAVLALALAAPVQGIHPGTDVVVAAAGAAPGVAPSYWLTDLVLLNPGTTDASATVSYLTRGGANPDPPQITVMVLAGETVVLPAVVRDSFGIEGMGALRVVSDQQLVVNTVIANNPSGSAKTELGAFGQGFPGIPVAAAVGAGQTTFVAGVVANAVERSNFGLVDVSGSGSSVRATLLAADGTSLGSRDIPLGGWEPTQRNVSYLANADLDGGTVRFEVLSGRVIAYGSRVNEGSGDPTTLEMSWAYSGGELDGTYHFIARHADGDLAGGGSLTIAGGRVHTLCGNLLFLGREPGCSLWLPFCNDRELTLAELAAGVELEVGYTDQGSGVGRITWTAQLTVTPGAAVSGSLAGLGADWPPSGAGCNGAFDPVTVSGGVR